MRFSGERQVMAPVGEVWATLHNRSVLGSIIHGCEEMLPLDDGRYAATLLARVGPMTDTYRGIFAIEDLRPGTDLRVRVGARGRCGRLDVDLRVVLGHGREPGTTELGYVADATVGGFVARLGTPTLSVAGSHFTGCFFRDLDRSLRRGVPAPTAGVAG